MKPNWQSAALVIGLVGGLITIPKLTIDLVRAVYHHPNVEVSPDEPIVLTYNKKLNKLEGSTGVLVYNSGDKADFITLRNAHLGVTDNPSGGMAFSCDVILKDGEHEISIVFADPSTAKSLKCEFTVPLSDSIRGLFTQQPTGREFVLELVSKDGKREYPTTFHFDLTMDVLKQLEKPGVIRLVDSVK